MELFVRLEQGEIPESLDGGLSVAEYLAVRLDDLDTLARQDGVRPLSDFVLDYSEQFDDIMADDGIGPDLQAAAFGAVGASGPWFDAEEGVRTARALIDAVERGGAADGGADGLLVTLGCLRDGLQYACDHKVKFHLAGYI